jgi:cytochrome c5
MAEHPTEAHQEDHASFIKTPQQLIVVVVLAFALPIAIIAMLAHLFGINATRYDKDHPAMTDEAIAKRIKPVGEVAFGDPNQPIPEAGGAPAPAPGAAKVAQSGEAVYKSVCQVCHAAGVLNAPKPGDKAAWGKLIAQGLDTLTANAIKGIKAMPPRGGNPSLSDLEIQRAIVHMANQSGASWKEPEAVASK